MMRPPTTPQQRPGVWLHQPLAGSSIQTPEEDYSVSLEEFKRIGALNMLEFDDRPSFVIDLLSKSFRSKVLIPLHINPALRAEDVSLALLLGTATENDGLKGLPTFWEWTASWTEQEDGRKTSVPLYGWYWAAIVLDGRWGIFQAVKRVAAKKSSSLNPNDLRTMAAGDCMPSATQRLASSNENLGMGDSTSSLNASLTSTWTAPEYQTSEVDPQLRLDGQEEWNLGRRPKNTLPSGSPSLPILSQEPSSSRHRRVASGEYRDGTQKDNRRNRSSSRDAEPRLQSPTRHEISRLDGRDGKLARPRRTQKGIPPRNSSKGFSSQETSETAPIPLPNDPLTEITHQSKALPVKPLQRNDKNHIEGGDSKDSKDIKDGKEKGNTKKPLLDRGPEVRVLYTDSMDGNEIDAIVFSRHDRYLTDKHIDWLIDDLAPCPNKYAQFLREYDWASTPLGPIKDWSFQLRSLVHTMVTDPEPAAILWGTNLSLIYNEGCVQVIGRKHPGGLGTSMASVFGELWQHISPMAKSASEGKPAGMKDLSLPMMRYGFLEETYWSFMMLPIIGPTGKTIGIYDRFSEVTKRVLTDRRMELIISLSDCGSEARDLDDLWDLMLKTIEISDHSKPYGIIYTVSPATPNAEGTLKNSQPLPSPSIKACVLAKTFGIRPDTLPQSLDLYDCQTPLEKAFIEAWGSNSPVFLRFIDGALPDFLAVSVDDRGHGDACKIVAIMPVRCGHEKGLVAFLVLGLNPRRPFEEYPEFIRLLHRRLIDAASSVFLPLEERRNQAALREAAIRQATVATELLGRTQEAEQKQARFVRLAERASVGMYLFYPDGSPLYINDQYFELLGIERYGHDVKEGWTDAIHPDDLELVQRKWKLVTRDKTPVVFSFRVKKPFKFVNEDDGTEVVGETWLESTIFPETAEDGSCTSVFGSLTEISHQKWAENLQKRRLNEAIEAKRASENFIDMTSHEMRNPLSAILQSADGINSILSTMQAAKDCSEANNDAIEGLADNAQTIILCAQHQKRIVDDILTLSKLDSSLLIITPDKTDPIGIVQHVIKMYEGELTRHSIDTTLLIDRTYRDLEVGYVLLDPTRLIQVLINLLTNAIKFTQLAARRVVTVGVAASKDRPKTGPQGTLFIPPGRQSRSGSNSIKNSPLKEELVGEPVFIHFWIEDSGRGLTEDESKLLFHRFSQATPRTHVQYGGSGLGLFISRELTELQGGQVGVLAKLGKGSTFAFYVKAARYISPRNSHPPSIKESVIKPLSTVSTAKKESKKKVGRETEPTPSPTTANLDVLIVEDNLINQKVMAAQLRRLGCRVHVANHGQEALTFLATTKWYTKAPKPAVDLNVVLMDLEMPVMDGLTCVAEIRRLQKTGEIKGHVPVIAVTANARDAQQNEAIRLGMDAIVTKPFRIPELIPKMNELASIESSRPEGPKFSLFRAV